MRALGCDTPKDVPYRARLLVTPLAVALATACVLVGVACYDIDALRGGARPGLRIDASPEADAAEAADASRTPGFCEQNDAALFCDDFDQAPDVPLTARWNGFEPVVPGVFVVNDAGASRGVGSISPRSLPFVLRTFGDSVGKTATHGVVVGSIPELGPEMRAIELSAAVHVPELFSYFPGGVDPREVEAGAEDPRAPSVSVIGIGASIIDPIGATLVLSPGALLLRTGVQGAGTETLATGQQLIGRYEFKDLLSVGWLRFTIVVGERAVIEPYVTKTLRKAPSCPNVLAVAVGWSTVPAGVSACIPLDDRILPLAGKASAFVLGTSFVEPARVRVELDDVLVRVVP
jgi:hypothetical protein